MILVYAVARGRRTDRLAPLSGAAGGKGGRTYDFVRNFRMVFLVLECRQVLHLLSAWAWGVHGELTRLHWSRGMRGDWKVNRRRLHVSACRVYWTLQLTHFAEQHKPHGQQHPTAADFDV